MNSPVNCDLARFYLWTLSRIRQKNQIRLSVDAMLMKCIVTTSYVILVQYSAVI